MRLTPRPYQVEAVHAVYDYFKDNKGNPLIAMPTGTGKSVVIAMFVESVFRLYKNQRVMMLTHVQELIEQNYSKLVSMWPGAPVGVYSAGLKRKESFYPITFAGIGSVKGKAHLFGRIDLLLIDEAHLVSPNDKTMYQQFIKDLMEINPYLKVIGLTATPWRLGQGRIVEDGLFTDICYDITSLHEFNNLIDEGYLSPVIPRATQTMLDVDGVHIRGGEFAQTELQLAVDKDEITYAALKETMELGADRSHWLIFASGVQHAEHICEMLNSLGVPSCVIHSKMTNEERTQRIDQFKTGVFRCAVNNNVLTTGFDFPEIDLIVVLRPTASPVLWVQMLGRGTRPVYAPGFLLDVTEGRLAAIAAGPKQNCLVLDFAGNTQRLGPINDPVIPRKKGKGGGDAPAKLCEACKTWNHASARECCYCGEVFKFAVKIESKASTNELIKIDTPIVEIVKVDHVTYSVHHKAGAEPSIRVAYFCGLNKYQQFVLVQHAGWGRGKALQWWRERTSLELPPATAEALALAPQLATPTHLRVWINKKYPEIMAQCFDGSAFGTVEPDVHVVTSDVLPDSQPFYNKLQSLKDVVIQQVMDDDDLPF